MLRIGNLIVNYGRVETLYGISLEVREYEIAVLIGSNGAGKTALFNSVSGCVIKGGKVRLVGESTSRLAPDKIARKDILYVPEGRHVFPGLTVEQNLLVGTAVNKGVRLSAGNNKGDLSCVYDIFPRLLERRKQLVWSLSGGEQQMLAIGRAITGYPRLLMLDEPSTGLAPPVIDKLSGGVVEINKLGTPILPAEQNTKLALKVSDRAYVLERGDISLSGKSKDLVNDRRVTEVHLSKSRQGPHNLEEETGYDNLGGK